MRLEEINALREMDQGELVKRLFELGVEFTDRQFESIWTTNDSLRLLIVEKTIEREEAGE